MVDAESSVTADLLAFSPRMAFPLSGINGTVRK